VVFILLILFGMMVYSTVVHLKNQFGTMDSGIKTKIMNHIGNQTVSGMVVFGMVDM
jgi:hypothetical protein